MPVARFDEAGRLAVDAALERGDAVVLPTPSPLAYVVAAKTVSAVNRAKGRPRDQPVALWEPRFEQVAPHLALDEAERRRLGWLLGVERVTALAPLATNDGAPGWLAPAARYGMALLFGVAWEPLAWLLERHAPLFVGSANRPGGLPAVDLRQVLTGFGPEVWVLDGDSLRDRARPHASTTTLRFVPGCGWEIHRRGIQDTLHATAGRSDYLADTLARADAALARRPLARRHEGRAGRQARRSRAADRDGHVLLRGPGARRARSHEV
ncbi:Sua5/YciO/YrdC/YwlC family protein [Sorangium sp. So ce321]|uniref:Sua5/YciO/YrdC/YwlC family protein n=1 Tax=Sorangium sp. So ce321 TaxID=3133300 RepID=UPI003F5E10A5